MRRLWNDKTTKPFILYVIGFVLNIDFHYDGKRSERVKKKANRIQYISKMFSCSWRPHGYRICNDIKPDKPLHVWPINHY